MNAPQRDLVIVGYGGAGAAAAIVAHDAGLRVCIVEKSREGGGNTRESGGSIRQIDDAKRAVRALQTYADAVTPDAVLRAFVDEVPATVDWLASLGANLVQPPAWTRGYPGAKVQTLEGAEREGTLGGRLRVASDDGRSGGEALWEVLRSSVEARNIEVRYEALCEQLLTEPGSRAVRGVRLLQAGRQQDVMAAHGVLLAAGGYGADRAMQKNFLGCSMPAMGLPDGNTGDGVRLAQQVGAGLWHMSAFATVLGYDLPGVGQAIQHQMQAPNYIYVDGSGHRFVDEVGYDWHALPHEFLPTVGEPREYSRVPAYVIFDEVARRAGPIINATTRAGRNLGWSNDNRAEIEHGWIQSGSTPEELARKLGVDEAGLGSSVAAYNAACSAGTVDEVGRVDLAPLLEPPFYGIAVLPIVCNTQGGPRRDERARVLDPFGSPIPGLYAAGECGSIWGKHYPGAGNVTEALVFGRIAGREVAARLGEESISA